MNGVTHTKKYKLLIINTTPGAGGHRLGRLFSCYENVYWYSHPNNGTHPWEYSNNKKISESVFSKYHYDRILPENSIVPLIGSRIEKYWDSNEWINNWYKIMSSLILPKEYLTFIVHDSPKYLRDLFPSSLIINFLENPIVSTTRHLSLSANYRINYKFENQVPTYKSKWVKGRDALLKIKPCATEKDLWMFANNKTEDDYNKEMFKEIQNKYNKNVKENEYANISLQSIDYNIKNYKNILGNIDSHYESLLL